MASVIAGTGGTCKAVTAEGQLQEIMTFLAVKQADSGVNPGQVINVFASHDQNARLFSGSYQLPATQVISGTGSLAITASTYLVGANFHVGTGGTFKSAAPEGYALEVLIHLQLLEQEASKNPNSRNYVNGSYNSETRLYSGSFQIPVVPELLPSGAIQYVADEYLLS